MKYCIFCGNSLEDYAVFCSRCGKNVLRSQTGSAQSNKDISLPSNDQCDVIHQPEAPVVTDAVFAPEQKTPLYEPVPVIMPRQSQYQNAPGSGVSANDTGGLVLGIISLALCILLPFFTSFVSLILGIIGAYLSSKAIKLCRTPKAVAGRITSVIAIILSSLAMLILLIFIAASIIAGSQEGYFSGDYYDLARTTLPYLF